MMEYAVVLQFAAVALVLIAELVHDAVVQHRPHHYQAAARRSASR